MNKYFALFNLLRIHKIQLNFLQLTILFYINNNNKELSLQDISKDLTLPFTTVQRVCESLEKGYFYPDVRRNIKKHTKGYQFIQREYSLRDKRKKLISITKKGQHYISYFIGTIRKNLKN